MCCKGIGLCIRETLEGSRTLFDLPLFLFVLFLCLCICVQLDYLNKALDVFNTAIVNPIYYVFFTSSVITASAILFQEWKHLTVIDCVANISGFLIVIIAMFMLSAFKDIQIALLDLYPSRRTRSREAYSDSILWQSQLWHQVLFVLYYWLLYLQDIILLVMAILLSVNLFSTDQNRFLKNWHIFAIKYTDLRILQSVVI